MSTLKDIISRLINGRSEGTYWDFKSEWHTNNAELLIDIVSLANNDDNAEAYLIFGVSDDFTINGVENATEGRMKKPNIIQLIGTKEFAQYWPLVDLQTIELRGHEVDVLIIKKSNKVPYYLSQAFKHHGKTVAAGVVYGRRGCSKFGTDRATPPDMIDKLYRIRYGLDGSIMERLHSLLDDFENWGCFDVWNKWVSGGDWGNDIHIYHKHFPEFQIKREIKEHEWAREPIMCFYSSPRSVEYVAAIYYHSTVIYEFKLIALDAYRLHIPAPSFGHYNMRNNRIQFYYLTLDSLNGKMFRVFTKGSLETKTLGLSSSENQWLLCFNDETEYNDYIRFCESNPGLYDDTIENVVTEIGREESHGLHFWPSRDILQARHYYDKWCELRSR